MNKGYNSSKGINEDNRNNNLDLIQKHSINFNKNELLNFYNGLEKKSDKSLSPSKHASRLGRRNSSIKNSLKDIKRQSEMHIAENQNKLNNEKILKEESEIYIAKHKPGGSLDFPSEPLQTKRLTSFKLPGSKKTSKLNIQEFDNNIKINEEPEYFGTVGGNGTGPKKYRD